MSKTDTVIDPKAAEATAWYDGHAAGQSKAPREVPAQWADHAAAWLRGYESGRVQW